MSAEGVGLVLGAATFFVTLIGIAITGGIAYGVLKTLVLKVSQKLDQTEAENRDSHQRMYDCQQATDNKVSKVEEHLVSLNGHIGTHDGRIGKLEERVS